MTEPIPNVVLEYASRVINALNSVDDGDMGNLYVREVPLVWHGEATPWAIVPNEHGEYALGVKDKTP